MQRLVATLLLLVLLAPLAQAQDGEADLLLRYPPQLVFTVWGNGTAYNANLLEAAAGDRLDVQLIVKVRGSDNRLQEDQSADATMLLATTNSTTTLDTATLTIPAGEGGPFPFNMSATLPNDLVEGNHEIRFRLQTGAWDPNPDNNDPRPVPLRVGERAAPTAQRIQGWDAWGGPLIAGLLVAIPLTIYATPLRAPAGRIVARVDQWYGSKMAWWLQRPAQKRRQSVQLAWAVALLGAWLLLIIGEGGLPDGWRGIQQAIVLAAVAVVLHLATVGILALRARLGGHDVEWHTAAVARSGLIVLAAGLFWQQLAAATPLVRWPDPAALVHFVVIGLTIGALFGLIAIGYTMVYGVLKFINFAHGEVFMWGAFFAWWLSADTAWLSFPVAVVAAVILTGLLGAVIERVAYRPLRGSSRLVPLITAIAVSLLLSSTAQFVFGAGRQSYSRQGSTFNDSPLAAWLGQEVAFGTVTMDHLAITTIVLSIVLMLALHLFVRHSRMGRAMRAVADDRETAETIGIHVNRVIVTTFVIGSSMAAVAGILFGLRFSIGPTIGLLTGIKAFTAAVVGGIGNIYGAFLGGFLIGLAENVGGQYIDSRFQNVIAFAILILFLLLRPQGIMPGPGGSDRK